jgi:uncharacterized protein
VRRESVKNTVMSKKTKTSYIPPCADCGGRCCKYTAIEIDKPTNKTDFDNIRWYLSHNNLHVFVDHDKKWHVEFRSPCENLGANHECLIYDIRPRICRNHGNMEEECEYFDSPYLYYFNSRTEFEDYLAERGIDWRLKPRKTKI